MTPTLSHRDDQHQNQRPQIYVYAMYVLVFIAAATSLVFLAPQLRFGSGPATGSTQILTSPERELAMAPSMSSSITPQSTVAFEFKARDRIIPEAKPYVTGASEGPSVIPIDLASFLGAGEYFGGISFDAYRCGVPLQAVLKDASDAEVDAVIVRFCEDLKVELAKLLNIEPSAVDIKKPVSMHFSPNSKSTDEAAGAFIKDPRHAEWMSTLSFVMSKYMIMEKPGSGGQVAVSTLACADSNGKEYKSVSEIGGEPCPGMSKEEVHGKIGFHALPFIGIETIAHDALKYGTCTKPPMMQQGFGHWLKTTRMFNESWKTFDVETADQDHVLLLFDMLYEKLKIFSKQYWLGVATMQNPFDIMAIANIIYETKPDLLIETGTANGGSAVLWSSIFELSGLHSSKVITIDITKPSIENDTTGYVWWQEAGRENPTQKPTWKKYVTFIQGSSTDKSVLDQVRKAASGGKKVMVLLDSNHGYDHVYREMMSLCPLVTLGSYCIVEDTKMSRWSSDGPLEAVHWFMDLHPDFEIDRSRELMYTHHPMGYVRRVKYL